MASHDRHRRRNSARNASLTAPKTLSSPQFWPQCGGPGANRQGGQLRFPSYQHPERSRSATDPDGERRGSPRGDAKVRWTR